MSTHGQSDYTPLKQFHLMSFLESCAQGLTPNKTWAHDRTFFIDCTSGSGYTEKSDPGSPFLLNRFACERFSFSQLCCEADPQNFAKLRVVTKDLYQLTVCHGDYTKIVPRWLSLQCVPVNKQPLGVIYCDPNGMKDLLHGYKMFQRLATSWQWKRLDFLFHWSNRAYSRNHGYARNHPVLKDGQAHWANRELLEVTDELRKLKAHAVIRDEVGDQEWMMMYLLNTDKVSLTWKAQGIMSYEEWRAEVVDPTPRQLSFAF